MNQIEDNNVRAMVYRAVVNAVNDAVFWSLRKAVYNDVNDAVNDALNESVFWPVNRAVYRAVDNAVTQR